MLELGCGDGGNLVAMAVALPGASFVGRRRRHRRDRTRRAARRRARAGQRHARRRARSRNRAPEPRASTTSSRTASTRGWRPPCAIACSLSVAARWPPHGVAYVSYNALPGGRLREALRDMLVFHTAGLERAARAHRAGPGAAALPGRGLARRARPRRADARPGRAAARPRRREPAARRARRGQRARLLPRVRRARGAPRAAVPRRGRLLRDADRRGLRARRRTRCSRCEDPVRREQYLDFLKGRMFRQTLLCRAELAVDRTPRPAVVERLAFSTRRRSPRRAGADGATFEGPTGSTLTTDQPLVIEALERAARALARRDLGRASCSRPRRSRAHRGLRGIAALLRRQPGHAARPPAALTTTPGDGPRPPARPPPGGRGRDRDEPAPQQRAHRGRAGPAPGQAARRHPRPRARWRRSCAPSSSSAASRCPRTCRRPGAQPRRASPAWR